MQLHRYHPESYEYLGLITADASPLEAGVYLIPAGATATPLPATTREAGQGLIYDPQHNAWQGVPDHRGETWYRTTDGSGSACVIDTLGTPLDSFTPQPRPSMFYFWRDGAWHADVDALRTQCQYEINTWRDQEEAAGFNWNDHHWDSDAESRTRILSVALAGIAPPNGYWTDANNVDVPLTDPADMQAMYTAMLTQGAAIHDHQRAMKREIETMTLEQLNAFIPAWPAV